MHESDGAHKVRLRKLLEDSDKIYDAEIVRQNIQRASLGMKLLPTQANRREMGACHNQNAVQTDGVLS